MRPTLRNSKLTPTVDLQKNMKYVAINVVFLIALRLSRKLENCLFPFYGEALGERQPSLRGERSSCMSPGGPSETSWGGSILVTSHLLVLLECSNSQVLNKSMNETYNWVKWTLQMILVCLLQSTYIKLNIPPRFIYLE